MPHNGAHVSCCAVVRGLQRNVFFVPREEVASPEIAALAAAAESDPAAKKQLIPLIHVRSAQPLALLAGQQRASCRHTCCSLLGGQLLPLLAAHPASVHHTTRLLPPAPPRSKPSRR